MDRPPQHWLHCTACDVKFMSRSAESLRHSPGVVRVEGKPPCVIIRCEEPRR